MLTDFNIAFVVIFAAEAVCKNLAVGPRVYFSRGWSRFDFAVVVVSVVGLFVSEGFGANALRALRVARIIRLVKRARTLRVMFNCFVLSLPSLWNIGSLLFVVIYIFAILGTSRRPVCECRRCGSLAGASLLNCRSRFRSVIDCHVPALCLLGHRRHPLILHCGAVAMWCRHELLWRVQ